MSTFDRALAESRLGTFAEIAERMDALTKKDELGRFAANALGAGSISDLRRQLADLAPELAASLQQALDATAPAAPADEVRVQMPQWPSPDKAWVVEQREGGYVVLPCPRQQADNAIRSVLADQVEIRDNLDAAIACAVHGHPGAGFAAYIRTDYLIDTAEDEYVIAL